MRPGKAGHACNVALCRGGIGVYAGLVRRFEGDVASDARFT